MRIIQRLTLLYAIALTLLLELPTIPLPNTEASYGWSIEGYEHVITFTLLGFLAELSRRKKRMLFWVLMLLCYSLGTEILQGLLAPLCHRMFDWKDFSHDALGVLLGTLVGYGCRPLFRR